MQLRTEPSISFFCGQNLLVPCASHGWVSLPWSGIAAQLELLGHARPPSIGSLPSLQCHVRSDNAGTAIGSCVACGIIQVGCLATRPWGPPVVSSSLQLALRALSELHDQHRGAMTAAHRSHKDWGAMSLWGGLSLLVERFCLLEESPDHNPSQAMRGTRFRSPAQLPPQLLEAPCKREAWVFHALQDSG